MEIKGRVWLTVEELVEEVSAHGVSRRKIEHFIETNQLPRYEMFVSKETGEDFFLKMPPFTLADNSEAEIAYQERINSEELIPVAIGGDFQHLKMEDVERVLKVLGLTLRNEMVVKLEADLLEVPRPGGEVGSERHGSNSRVSQEHVQEDDPVYIGWSSNNPENHKKTICGYARMSENSFREWLSKATQPGRLQIEITYIGSKVSLKRSQIDAVLNFRKHWKEGSKAK